MRRRIPCCIVRGGGGSTSTGSTSTGGTPATQQQQAASAAISSAGLAAFNANDPTSAMNAIGRAALKQPNVTSAVVKSTEVVVTYASGDKEYWFQQPDFLNPTGHTPKYRAPWNQKPIAQPHFQGIRKRGQASTTNVPATAVTINFASNDTLHGDVAAPLLQARNCLAAAGYRGKASAQPDSWSHGDFTLSSLSTLSGYGVVIMITHGGYDPSVGTIVQTGEKVNAANRAKYTKWWHASQIFPVNVLVMPPGTTVPQTECDWAFNGSFLTSDYFQDEGLPEPNWAGMVWFNGACDQFVGTDMQADFAAIGGLAEVGYDGPDTMSPWSMSAFVEAILCESNSQSITISNTPLAQSMVLYNDFNTGAVLKFFQSAPFAAHTLPSKPSMTLSSPTNNQFLPPNGTLSITGTISGYSGSDYTGAIPWAIIYGTDYAMQVNASTGTFSYNYALPASPSPGRVDVLLFGSKGVAFASVQVGGGN